MSNAYDILGHGMMIADRRRLAAYLKAIQQVVKPNDVVIDIGSGTGIFAVSACRAGARHVYAIEPDEIASVARDVVAANGCGARVTVIERLSTDIELPERADVLVLDVRGVLPDDQIPVARDAQARLLRDDAVVVPARDVLWASIVRASDLYERHIGAWDRNETDVDIRALRRLAVNSMMKCRVQPEHLVVEPRPWATLDYASLTSEEVRATLHWTIRQQTLAHGLVAWFESTLADGIELSNRPGAPELLYGHAYFPWPRPIALQPGDVVTLDLTGCTRGGSYQWKWTTKVRAGSAVSGHRVQFEQDTGTWLASEQEFAPGAIPVLDQDAEIDRLALDLMSEGQPVRAIAGRLAEMYAARFPRAVDALTYVGRLSCLYG